MRHLEADTPTVSFLNTRVLALRHMWHSFVGLWSWHDIRHFHIAKTRFHKSVTYITI